MSFLSRHPILQSQPPRQSLHELNTKIQRNVVHD